MALQHLRSSTANKRPTPGSMSDGQLALNTNVASPGAFFKDSTGALVKAGPVHVGTTAPNASPAVGGQSGNSIGEQWLDTSASPAQLKVWNGTAWVSALPDELPVSKLADGAARQLLQTDAAGTGVEWTSNVDVPGTLDVTGAATFDSTVSIGGSNALVASDIGSTVQAYDADTAKTDATQTFTAAQTFGDNVTLNAQSDLRFADSDSSNWVAFQAPATVASNVTWTLPSADGTSGQVLSTDGAGALSWATAAGGATDKIEEGNSSVEVIDTGSDGRVVFTTEGNEVGRFDSSGRLGVGTTSPTDTNSFGNALDLNGTAGSAYYCRTAGSATNFAMLGHSGTTAYLMNQSNGPLTFWTNNSEKVRIDSSGRVGIGTTSPGQQLTVRASTAGIIGVDGGTRGGVSGYYLNGTLTSYVGNLGAILGNATAGLGLYTEPGNDIRFYTNGGNERLRIDTSGRLLVGTSSAVGGIGAGSRLQIRGNTAAAGAKLSFQRDQAASSIGVSEEVGQLVFSSNDGGDYALITARSDGASSSTSDCPGRLEFSTTADGASSPTERMRIDSSGRVGIGTTSPSANLHVQTSSEAKFILQRSNPFGSTFEIKATGDGIAGAAMFSLDSTERMRIDSSGRLLVGTSTSASNIALIQAYTASGSIASRLDSGAVNTNDIIYFNAEGGGRGASFGIVRRTTTNPCGFIYLQEEDGGSAYYWTDNSGNFRVSSSIDHTGTTSGTVVGTQTSDERTKNILGPVEYGLNTIKQIEPVRYAMKSEPDAEKLGFIAQQVQPLIPQSVFDTKEHIEGEPEDAPTKLGMEYVALIPVLVNAIKELSAEVDALKAQLA